MIKIFKNAIFHILEFYLNHVMAGKKRIENDLKPDIVG